MEYFKPLMDWLAQENSKNDACYGWGYTWPQYYNLPTPRCGATMPTTKTTTMTTSTPTNNVYRGLMTATMVLVAVCVTIVVIVLAIVIFILKSSQKQVKATELNSYPVRSKL